jgi:hypothetical protein|tara:strand:- start:2874 stop:3368 length:495 start_codon:yes stop_codon:yes gene_type:complete
MKIYKIPSNYIIFVIVLLLSSLLVFTVAQSKEDKARQEVKRNNEKIISVLENGIGLLKYEIKRDHEVASRKMKRTGIRQLRIALKKDIGPKEQLIKDLKLHLADELTAEIGSIQKTLELEEKIVKAFKVDSSRVRRNTRNIIKQSISVKENILASFEKFLSKLQ